MVAYLFFGGLVFGEFLRVLCEEVELRGCYWVRLFGFGFDSDFFCGENKEMFVEYIGFYRWKFLEKDKRR